MQRTVTLLTAAGLLAAGCSSAPAVTAGTAPGPSASAAPAASSAPASDPNVAACRAMEAYPGGTSTTAQAHAYIAFLGKQIGNPGESTRLNNAIERTRADLSAFLLGAASQARVIGDARHLQAVCTGYGVRGGA